MAKKIPKKKKEVKEIFEVKEKGKKKEIVSTGTEEELIEKPNQKKEQAKILKSFLLIFAVIIGLIVGGYYYVDSLRYKNYDGVEYTTVSEGELIFYKTMIMGVNQGKLAPYNFYLRTNPDKLERMDFDRTDYELRKLSLLNVDNPEEFSCDGDGVIAIANLQYLHSAMGIQFFMNDNESGCDEEGRYTYYHIVKGDKTEIVKTDKLCYEIRIKDCEIIPATEKIMAEMILSYNEL